MEPEDKENFLKVTQVILEFDGLILGATSREDIKKALDLLGSEISILIRDTLRSIKVPEPIMVDGSVKAFEAEIPMDKAREIGISEELLTFLLERQLAEPGDPLILDLTGQDSKEQ